MPPKKKNTLPSPIAHLDDSTPRTIEQMAPTVVLFWAEEPGRPQDEIDVPFAIARVTQDGKGEREPRPSDHIVPPRGVLREG